MYTDWYTGYMNWCFAKANGRLAEIFFDREDDEDEPKMMGHCYVSASEYKTKREQKMIEKDTKRCQFSYRNKVYRDKIKNKILQNAQRPAADDVTSMSIEEIMTLLKNPET